MLLLDLANEVLLSVARHLESARDISAFSRSNCRLHDLLNQYLYRFDIERNPGQGLSWAAKHGREEILRRFLAEGDIPTTTALTIVVAHDHKAMVAYLLEKGADPNGWSGLKRSALNTATFYGNLDMAALLLDNGADINAPGNHYDSGCALHIACKVWSMPMAKLLLDRGADVNALSVTRNTVLQGALSSDFLEVVPLLLEKGADVNARGQPCFGGSLHFAASMGYKSIVRMLLDKGADVNAQGGVFGNALQAAVARGHKETVELLLERGADVNARGGTYPNPLSAALDQYDKTIVSMLRAKGARQDT